MSEGREALGKYETSGTRAWEEDRERVMNAAKGLWGDIPHRTAYLSGYERRQPEIDALIAERDALTGRPLARAAGSDIVTEQLMPIHRDGASDITELVIERLKARREQGIATYGTTLQPRNGRDALEDALAEALDLAQYLTQAIEERGAEQPVPLAAASLEEIEVGIQDALAQEANVMGSLSSEYWSGLESGVIYGVRWREQRGGADWAELRDVGIPCELFCPQCGAQHVDAPDTEQGWDNPPHRTHKCHACGHLWRPYPVATFGVLAQRPAASAEGEHE